MRWERVEDPGFSLTVPADPAASQLDWLRGWAVADDGSLVIGSSATVVRAGSTTIVVDPFLAFDDPARIDQRLDALRAAGCDPASVDIVVNTHDDGIGVNLDATGAPAFPNARYVLPEAEWATAAERWGPIAPDLVAPGPGGEELVPGVRLESAPGHNPGMVVVWLGDDEAVIVGHLLLHPAQMAVPSSEIGDLDPVALEATRRALLSRCVEHGTTLIGPLFAAPGAGTVEPAGDTWRLRLP